MIQTSIRNRGQRGFTLVELISVIIILGILAAVITPKYFDMTEKATDSVAKGVKSEAISRLNMAYAKYIMTNGATPTNAASLLTTDYLGGTGAIDIGDYTLTYSGGGTDTSGTAVDVSVTVAGDTTPDPTANWTTAQKTFTFPWPN